MERGNGPVALWGRSAVETTLAYTYSLHPDYFIVF